MSNTIEMGIIKEPLRGKTCRFNICITFEASNGSDRVALNHYIATKNSLFYIVMGTIAQNAQYIDILLK